MKIRRRIANEFWPVWKKAIFWHTAIFVWIFITPGTLEPTEVGPLWIMATIVDFPSTFIMGYCWGFITDWFPGQILLQRTLAQAVCLIVGGIHWVVLSTVYVFFRQWWINQFPLDIEFDYSEDE